MDRRSAQSVPARRKGSDLRVAQQLEPADLEKTVNEFQQKLERLRTLYEQYFIGVQKREPQVPLKDVVRLMRLLDTQHIQNTGLRYRYRMLVQKYNSYRTYWKRTLRAIETGTYHRDLARLRRKLSKRGVDMAEDKTLRSAGDVERAMRAASKTRRSATEIRGKPAEALKLAATPDSGLADAPPAATTAPPPPPTAARDNRPVSPTASKIKPPPTPTATPPPPPPTAAQRPRTAMGEEQYQSLYRRLIRAKRMCGEETNSVRYQALKETIQRQLPALKKQHQGKDIEFQVVIRKGRAILKAKPKP